MIFHFAGEHAASFLWIVTFERLNNKNRNDDSEQDALSPEGVEIPERSWLDTEIDRVQQGFGQ